MDEKETNRLEAFSDGVFAVAITLLVLGFQPPPQHIQLKQWFLEQLPFFLAFLTSFATIGVMWINHHRLFTYIKQVDSVLMALNLLLLLVIVFIPYPTELVAQYITRPGDDSYAAALLYSGTSIVLAVAFNVLWRYAAYENRLLGKNVNQHEVQAITDQYRFGPLFYLVSFGLAWIIPLASVALNLLYAIYFALPSRKRSKSGDIAPSTDAADSTNTVQEPES